MKDPLAIGLFGFAVPLFILSAMFAGYIPMAGIGTLLAMALGFGGAAMFVGGVLTFQIGNSYVATAFFTYGAFFVTLALAGNSGALVATMKDAPQLLSVWYYLMAVITAIFWLPAFRLNIGLVLMFGALMLGFIMLGMGSTHNGALLLLITSGLGFYLGAVHVINPVVGRALLPVGSLAKKA
ncbi:acetate uptake transporter [Halothiobacillus sp. DCM-1]|uniref:acetate uptake transporter n=1 Tax=Halothiobacillus sp. DCM-1 TaxID=3112558 RepID=UPI00324B35DF